MVIGEKSHILPAKVLSNDHEDFARCQYVCNVYPPDFPNMVGWKIEGFEDVWTLLNMGIFHCHVSLL